MGVGGGSGGAAAGATVGGHRLVRLLGRGGMGEVWEADDPALRRPVAVKLIAPHLAQEPGFRARFTREARALAALDSPHVVQVHAHGEDDGRLYLVTQLVPDGDLGALLRSAGPLPADRAVDLARQVATGLADAHAAGLVHGDLKPANVLLRRRGEGWHAYLSDFGVARRLGAEETRVPGTVTAGTPSYMAPELHTGGEPTVASDVYAVGCLLWTALTGAPPYSGSSDFEVATAHREQPVPQLAGSGPAVPVLDDVLARALAKDPADRYSSAAELAAALGLVVERPELAVPPPSRQPSEVSRRGTAGPRTPLLAAGLVALVVLAAAGTAYALTRAGDGPAPAAGPTGSPSSVTASAVAPPLPTPTQPSTAPGAFPTEVVMSAVASLADALEAQGVSGRERAECAAARWIAGVGLQEMADAGFFDESWRYVDRGRAALTPEMELAADRAVRLCSR